MKIVLFAPSPQQLLYHRLSFARFLGREGWDVILASAPEPEAQAIIQSGADWRPVRLLRGFRSPWADIVGLWDLAQLLRRERPSALHVFTTKAVAMGAPAIEASRRPVALVNSITGLGPAFALDRLSMRAARSVLKRALYHAMNRRRTLNLFENPDDLVQMRHIGLLRRDNAVVVPGAGVPTDRFRPSTPRLGGRMRALLACRYLVSKGLREYAAAAGLVRDRGRQVEFLLAGGPDPASSEAVSAKQVALWTSSGVITELGHQSDMPSLYSSIDVAVLPSYREGLSRFLLEAAAAGKAIIASDVPGCRQCVTPGESGILIPAKDPVALADAICFLDSDRALCARMGEKGRQMACEQFDEKIVFERVLEAYAQLCTPGLQARAVAG